LLLTAVRSDNKSGSQEQKFLKALKGHLAWTSWSDIVHMIQVSAKKILLPMSQVKLLLLMREDMLLLP
jgi:hypothetical protein